MAIYDVNGNVISSGGTGGASPIAGERIIMLGDSNMQYNAEGVTTYMEETYGCDFTVLAKAGITWEYIGEDVSSAEEVTAPCGIGYVNQLISQADGNTITAFDRIVIMLGTNCNNVGTLSDTRANFNTMCGAIRYCLERLCYYGRSIKIGIVIPIRWNDGYTPGPNTGSLPTSFGYIQELARQFSIPTLNMWNEGRVLPDGFTPDGKSYYLADDKHMGGNGSTQFMKTLGKWIAYSL